MSAHVTQEVSALPATEREGDADERQIVVPPTSEVPMLRPGPRGLSAWTTLGADKSGRRRPADELSAGRCTTLVHEER